MKFTAKFYSSLSKDPKGILEKLSIDDIANLMQILQQAYYNTSKSLVSDDVFDIVKDTLENRDKNHPILKNVGAYVSDKDSRKVLLPVYMGSLDKIKEQKGIENFSKKYNGPYVVTGKLDGVSALFVKKNSQMRLYTRGDGKQGQDISHLLNFIQMDNGQMNVEDCMVRGELIISKKNWDELKNAHIKNASNARNTVAGLVNSKKPDLKIASMTDFVAYSLISPQMPVNQQFEWLKKNGYKYPVPKKVNTLNFDNLTKILGENKDKSKYEADGIVISHNDYHIIETDKNPTYAFAFKSMASESGRVVVTSIEWNVSKDGFVKPTILFPATKIGGVNISRATGHNAFYITSNCIGPGSILMIKRSGDVIPYVDEVKGPSSSGKPQMPDIPWEWETEKDIKTKTFTKDQELKQIVHFFEKIKVKGFSSGTITKIYNSGYTSIKKIMDMKAQDGLIKGALLNEIHLAVRNASCLQLMHASNTFGAGFGERKLKLILDSISMLNTNHSFIPSVGQLIEVEGVSNITANKFLKGLKLYREFMIESNLNCKTFGPKSPNKSSTQMKFKDQIVVFTGFRNKEWEEIIKNEGGQIGTSITGKTTLVVAKDASNSSGKLENARKKGIKVIDMTEFIEMT